MSTEVAIPTSELIRRELDLAEARLRDSLEHYFAAGAMLIQAKRSLPHGGWLPWLERYVGIGQREAQRYMKLAEHRDEIEAANPSCMSDLSLNAALRQISKPKRPALVAVPDLGCGDSTSVETPSDETRDWSEQQQGKRDRALHMLRESARLIESSEALARSGIPAVLRESIAQGRRALAIVDELASSFEP